MSLSLLVRRRLNSWRACVIRRASICRLQHVTNDLDPRDLDLEPRDHASHTLSDTPTRTHTVLQTYNTLQCHSLRNLISPPTKFYRESKSAKSPFRPLLFKWSFRKTKTNPGAYVMGLHLPPSLYSLFYPNLRTRGHKSAPQKTSHGNVLNLRAYTAVPHQKYIRGWNLGWTWNLESQPFRNWANLLPGAKVPIKLANLLPVTGLPENCRSLKITADQAQKDENITFKAVYV